MEKKNKTRKFISLIEKLKSYSSEYKPLLRVTQDNRIYFFEGNIKIILSKNDTPIFYQEFEGKLDYHYEIR